MRDKPTALATRMRTRKTIRRAAVTVFSTARSMLGSSGCNLVCHCSLAWSVSSSFASVAAAFLLFLFLGCNRFSYLLIPTLVATSYSSVGQHRGVVHPSTHSLDAWMLTVLLPSWLLLRS